MRRPAQAAVSAQASAVVPAAVPVKLQAELAPALVHWQGLHGRHGLPWQHPREPYRVWISEIMLQQTQVATVLGYFERFMQRFPDVATLATAPLDDVLAHWAGLGYYSRARNLHRCAQEVVAHHSGKFPCTAAGLVALPGIGPSTAAAIAAFCFGERAAILDGNVKRVLSRLLAFGEDLAQAAAHRRLHVLAQALLPQQAQDMPTYTQALMDLGATVCTQRAPDCPQCPVRPLCAAHAQGRVHELPVKRRPLRRGQRESWWLWLHVADRVLLAPRPKEGIWGGLYVPLEFADHAACDLALETLQPLQVKPLPSQRHVLTHLDWLLHAAHVELADIAHAEALRVARGARWVARGDWHTLGLPAPFARQLSLMTR